MPHTALLIIPGNFEESGEISAPVFKHNALEIVTVPGGCNNYDSLRKDVYFQTHTSKTAVP